MAGECFLCHTAIPKAQAGRHVAACLKVRPSEPEHGIKTLHLVVEGKYLPMYWMHIEIATAAKLHDLDAFLRKTWLECCYHLSCFTIGGEKYAYQPSHDHFSGRREQSMEAKLYQVIPPGTVFAHEYDYGSTTNLVLRTVGAYEAAPANQGVRMLARNSPLSVACAVCGQPATIVEAGWDGLNLERCFCAACADAKIEEETMRMPIVNSPRVGVCGYGG